MTEASKYPQRNVWQLVHLGHELDEIAARLDSLAAQLNRGIVDEGLYEDTRRQIKKCGEKLDKAFDRRMKSQRGE